MTAWTQIQAGNSGTLERSWIQKRRPACSVESEVQPVFPLKNLKENTPVSVPKSNGIFNVRGRILPVRKNPIFSKPAFDLENDLEQIIPRPTQGRGSYFWRLGFSLKGGQMPSD